MKEYLYVLKLRSDLLVEDAWTEKEENIVGNHFSRLKMDTDNGKVILAGRTLNSDDTQFGIVIFLDESWDSAMEYMNKDPAVQEGVMTATLYPYRVALMKK
ncbi:MAG: hypothetical protein EU533_00335 [Promethearchaeota archaeon]|nr:MAG: hypothetical protein EU533_00335 [Candidatus Lokiarchaeota archaeon]